MLHLYSLVVYRGFPDDSDSKESTGNAGDLSSIPGLRKSPGAGHGNPLQYSFWENPMDRGAWRATAYGVTKSQTQLKRLSTHTCVQNLSRAHTTGHQKKQTTQLKDGQEI